MKPRRVAAFAFIAGLALADIAGAVYLSVLWQEQHPAGGPAQADASQAQDADSRAPQQRRLAVERLH